MVDFDGEQHYDQEPLNSLAATGFGIVKCLHTDEVCSPSCSGVFPNAISW